jgi:5'-nucleotidase (lipoprotein e(P4) family)
VILDADETVISNLQYQIELADKHQTHTAEAWRAWVTRRAATPVPGAAAFLTRTRELGGRIAIVTNRLGSECADTEALFRERTLAFDMMLCRPDGTPSDKNPRFAAVAAGTTKYGGPPLDVLLFVGDNILDFPGLSQASIKQDPALLEPFGSRFFALPNPMYGSWQ